MNSYIKYHNFTMPLKQSIMILFQDSTCMSRIWKKRHRMFEIALVRNWPSLYILYTVSTLYLMGNSISTARNTQTMQTVFCTEHTPTCSRTVNMSAREGRRPWMEGYKKHINKVTSIYDNKWNTFRWLFGAGSETYLCHCTT